MAEMIDTAKETSNELGKLDGLTKEEEDNIARIVGLGALKYFLSLIHISLLPGRGK